MVRGIERNSRCSLSYIEYFAIEFEPKERSIEPTSTTGETDVTDYDPSFDLWGGGGIAITVGDLADFTRALFTGSVYNDPETLNTMLSTFDGITAASDATERSLEPGSYRMGVWVIDRDTYTIYRHSGFWCTSATYGPEFDLVVTATVNQHEEGALFDEIEEGAIRVVQEFSSKSE